MFLQPQTRAVKTTMLIAGGIFTLMMALGIAMRTGQTAWIGITPGLDPQILSMHGIGVLGTAALSGASMLWYFCSRHIVLSAWVFRTFVGTFLLGGLLIAVSIMIIRFGGNPAAALTGQSAQSTALRGAGCLMLAISFSLLYLELGRQILARYDSPARVLGWEAIRGHGRPLPPATIVATSAIIAFSALGMLLSLALLLGGLLGYLGHRDPLDVLLIHNALHLSGHVFVSVTIFSVLVAVYEILPGYTGRRWIIGRGFLWSWNMLPGFALALGLHHGLQGMGTSEWADTISRMLCYATGLPLIAGTLHTGITHIRGARIDWDLTSSLLVLAVAGWALGAVPVIGDGIFAPDGADTTPLWARGHFYSHLMLGEVAMAFAFMAWLVRDRGAQALGGLNRAAYVAYVAGGCGFVLAYLTPGLPHNPQLLQDHVAIALALSIILATIWFMFRYIWLLSRHSNG